MGEFTGKITPYFSSRPWAGSFLKNHFRTSQEDVGEAWILSTLPEGESLLQEKPLSQVLGKKLPYLIKVIDAASPLSIQVHPDDDWARELENSRGKTECWLIVAAEQGAGVYLGVRSGISSEMFRDAIERNERVDDLMNFISVGAGDFIQVPAGTIHAIGAGVTILEVQQASGITYRLWDWNRKGRELHLEKGLKVADFSRKPLIERNVLGQTATLMSHRDFTVELNQSSGEGWFIDLNSLEVSQTIPQGNYLFVR